MTGKRHSATWYQPGSPLGSLQPQVTGRTINPGTHMLFALAVLFAVMWFLCYSVFSVTAGGFIHIFLVLAVISIGLHFLRKRRVLWGRDAG